MHGNAQWMKGWFGWLYGETNIIRGVHKVLVLCKQSYLLACWVISIIDFLDEDFERKNSHGFLLNFKRKIKPLVSTTEC